MIFYCPKKVLMKKKGNESNRLDYNPSINHGNPSTLRFEWTNAPLWGIEKKIIRASRTRGIEQPTRKLLLKRVIGCKYNGVSTISGVHSRRRHGVSLSSRQLCHNRFFQSTILSRKVGIDHTPGTRPSPGFGIRRARIRNQRNARFLRTHDGVSRNDAARPDAREHALSRFTDRRRRSGSGAVAPFPANRGGLANRLDDVFFVGSFFLSNCRNAFPFFSLIVASSMGSTASSPNTNGRVHWTTG